MSGLEIVPKLHDSHDWHNPWNSFAMTTILKFGGCGTWKEWIHSIQGWLSTKLGVTTSKDKQEQYTLTIKKGQ